MRVPSNIVMHSGSKTLEVVWPEGQSYRLPFEFLRVESPSAEVQGHRPGEETLQVGKRDVKITAIEPVGNYALKLVFDDGHDSGLYSWEYLERLCLEHDSLWQDYLAQLEKAGASRDPDDPRNEPFKPKPRKGCSHH